MAPKHARDEQPRNRWPLNEAGADPYASRRRSSDDGRPAAGTHQARHDRAAQDGAAKDRAANDGAESTLVEASTVASASGTGRTGAAVAERESFERVGYSNLYQSGDPYADFGADDGSPGRTALYLDDTVLGGLHYTAVAPRRAVADDRWAASLRTFARAAVWCLPAAVILGALSSVFGWPTDTSEPSLVSPGTWVVLTALGFGLWLIGVAALAALVAPSPARPWGFVAVVASSLGVALLTPVVGATGLARPAITRTARSIENDQNIAAAAARMQAGLLDHTAGRWLIVGGTVLLAIGAVAVVGAIYGSRVLSRPDGWLVLAGVGLAVAAAFLAWTFLLTLGAMVMLAGVLGLAYTVSRIAPDGTAPPAY